MKPRMLAGVLLTLGSVTVAQGGEPSLCTQLAEEARRAPAATWAQQDPLATWLRDDLPEPPARAASALSQAPRWREAVGALHDRPLEVRKLDRAPVFMLSEYGGTANCQTLVLLRAEPGKPAAELAMPFKLEGESLCVTQSARFLRVLGQPALVVGGAPTMASPDAEFRIATWREGAWHGRCRIEWQRQTAIVPGARFCAPGSAVCQAGQAVAARIVQAYEASRASGQPIDDAAVNAGRRPDAAVLKAMAAVEDGRSGHGPFNPQFPHFGVGERQLDPMLTEFSNADPRLLPVWVQGRWLQATVGRAGVGWRESDAVLVTLAERPGKGAQGVASYQFLVKPTSLRNVVVEDLAPEK